MTDSPYRIFLVLVPFREVLPRLSQALRPLDDIDPYLPGAEGFYDPREDAALVGLQFNRRAVERIGAHAIIDLLVDCGLPVIAPEELGEAEYEAFYAQHLPIYETHLQQYPSAAEPLPLVRRIVMALEEHAAVAAGAVGPIRPAARPPTYLDYEITPTPQPPPARASSRWELDLDDYEFEYETTAEGKRVKRPSSNWELIS